MASVYPLSRLASPLRDFKRAYTLTGLQIALTNENFSLQDTALNHRFTDMQTWIVTSCVPCKWQHLIWNQHLRFHSASRLSLLRVTTAMNPNSINYFLPFVELYIMKLYGMYSFVFDKIFLRAVSELYLYCMLVAPSSRWYVVFLCMIIHNLCFHCFVDGYLDCFQSGH